MSSAQDHLWGHVLGAAAVGVSLAALADLLGQAEVDDLAVAVCVDQNVLGLEVAI